MFKQVAGSDSSRFSEEILQINAFFTKIWHFLYRDTPVAGIMINKKFHGTKSAIIQ